ncbi:MAG: hypothetical protein BMS9Abin26_1107 [Gammaproteobacteria bacterium]|nr:MAG: hypothetical protein BMS9Abin26_1107 [Gammaproteobacteria bacterium]
MNLIRLIVVFLVVWIIIRMLRNYLAKKTVAKQPPAQIDTMVKCKVCDLHIPEQEAIRCGDDYYCCQEHKQLNEP